LSAETRQEVAPAGREGSEPAGPGVPLGAEILVAIATAALFGGLGIGDGGIEPGGYSFAGVAAWFAVILMLVFGGGLLSRLPRGVYVASGLLFALALLAGLSATWSGDAGTSVDIAVRSALYAAILIGAAVAVASGAGRAMLVGLAIGGLAIVAVALGGRLIAGEIAPSDAARIRAEAGGRLTSPIGYWNGLGVAAAVTSVVLIWLGSHLDSRRWRLLATALAPAAVLTLAMTSSRGAAVGIVGGVAVLALASPLRGRVIGVGAIAAACAAPAFICFRAADSLRLGLENSAADKAGLVVLGLLVAAGIVAWLLAKRFDERLGGWRPSVPPARALVAIGVVCAGLLAVAVATTAGDDNGEPAAADPSAQAGEIARRSDSYRLAYWETAFDAWKDEPIRGVGAGGFHLWWIADPGKPQPVVHAHSLFFQYLSEFGLVGLIGVLAFVGLIGAVGVARVRVPRSPGLQALVAAGLGLFTAVVLPAFVDWTWSIPAAMTGLLAGAALVLGLDAAAVGSRRIVAVLAVAALSGLAFSASTYMRETEIENSREALAELDYEEAADAAERADRWAPWNSEGLEHEAAALSADGKPGPAATRVRDAIDLAPKRWLLQLEAGLIAQARGQRVEAEFRFAEAERLNDFLEAEAFAAEKEKKDKQQRDRKRRGRN
jgi:O-antigen ligase